MSILLARLCNLAPSLLGLHFFGSVHTLLAMRRQLAAHNTYFWHTRRWILLHQIDLIHERVLVFTNNG
jgi:hypothetical protein